MVSLATKHNDPEASLGWNERLGYGTGRFGMNMVNAIIGSFVTLYYTTVAMMDPGIISTIIAASKIFDGVSDLIIGNIVDHTKSKMGKARAWLFRMCIPFAISTVLLFWVPTSFPNMLKYVYFFIMYNVVNTVFLTFMFVPVFSLLSLMTRNGYERGLLGNISEIFSTLGNIAVNSVFSKLLAAFSTDAANIHTQRAYTCTLIIVGIVVVASVMITVLTTKERVTDDGKAEQVKEEKKKDDVSTIAAVKALITNRYWLMMILAMFTIFFVVILYSVGGVFYCQYIWMDMDQLGWMGNSISVAQMAVMFATPFLMKKLGKRWTYTIGMGVLTLGFLGFGLFGTSKVLMIIFNVCKGLGLGMAGGMALGMIADTITYGKWKTGIDAVGMGNAASSAAQKLGMGLGTAVFGWVLSAAGLSGELEAQGLPQPESVGTAIKFMYTWVPFVLCLFVFLLMLFFFDLEKKMKQMDPSAKKA